MPPERRSLDVSAFADSLRNGTPLGGFAVYGDDDGAAEVGVALALRALISIEHPEEPENGLVKFTSGVRRTRDGGIGALLDAPDVAALGLEETVVAALREALETAGVSGRVVAASADELFANPSSRASDPPAWLPIPANALDVKANFFDDRGYLEFWTSDSPRENWTFYEKALAAEGFEVEDSSVVDVEGLHMYSANFVRAGVRIEFQNGYRFRPTVDDPEREIKVHLRLRRS